MKTDFLISNKGQELIKNEEELRVKLSEFVGELPNAAIVDELSNAAKYYTNNGESNTARYSFRLKDICLPTLLFSYFSYALRSMWIYAGIVYGAIVVLSFFGYFYFKPKGLSNSFDFSYISYVLIYVIISVLTSATYRYFLLKEFFTKYELTLISKPRKPINILIAIGFIIALLLVIKLISLFIVGASVMAVGGVTRW